MNNKRKILIIAGIVMVVLMLMGGTYAYLSWISNESQKTVVNFATGVDFSCAADGGGNTAINTVYTDQTSTAQYNAYGFYTWDGYLLSYVTNTKTSTHDISKVASTTGNITGVYDMSGGSWDGTMGVFANSDGTLWSGYDTTYNSGFTGLVGSNGTSYTGVNFPNSKYYDVYKAASGTSINALTACDGGICYGHGLSEVKGWNDDYTSFANVNYPWFMRGGAYNAYNNGANAGTFNFNGGDGNAGVASFRSVISYVG